MTFSLNPDYKTINDLRQEKGLSQKALSKLANVSVNTLSLIESGKPCKVDTLKKIAEALEVAIDELLPKLENNKQPTLPNELGLLDCYFGGADNDRRNISKQTALDNAVGEAVLLARTGHSYLYVDGVHYPAVRRFLDRSQENNFLVILQDPVSPGYVPTCLRWLRSKFSSWKKADQSAYDLNTLLKQRSLKLRASLLTKIDQLEIRLSKHDMVCTTLWTSGKTFVEPYLHLNEDERTEKRLTTLELYVESKSDLARSIGPTAESTTHIEFYREASVGLSTWYEGKSRMIDITKEFISLLRDSNEINDLEYEAIKDYLREWSNFKLYD